MAISNPNIRKGSLRQTVIQSKSNLSFNSNIFNFQFGSLYFSSFHSKFPNKVSEFDFSYSLRIQNLHVILHYHSYNAYWSLFFHVGRLKTSTVEAGSAEVTVQ